MAQGNYALGNLRKYLSDHPEAAPDHDAALGAAQERITTNNGPLTQLDICDILPGSSTEHFFEEVSDSDEHHRIYVRETGCGDCSGNSGVAGAVQSHPELQPQAHNDDEGIQRHGAD